MTTLARARAARIVERRADDGTLTEYLAFRVSNSQYALPVAIVREIARGANLTPVPRAPSGVLGITSFRGRVITVIDMGSRLVAGHAYVPEEETERPLRPRILIVDIGPETLGYLVDEVMQVHRLSPRDIERTTTVGADVGLHVTGIARPEGFGVVLLLDPKALVP